MSWSNFAERAREKCVALSRINPCAKFHLMLPGCSLYTSDDARIVFEIVRLAKHELGRNGHAVVLDLVTKRDWTAKTGPFISWWSRSQNDGGVISLREWLKCCGYDPEQLLAEPQNIKSEAENNRSPF